MDRIIFLDIDGVLNSQAYVRDAHFPKAVRTPGLGPDFIDPVRVARLQQIVDRTGAQIAISSNWTNWPGCNHGAIADWLRRLGFTGEVIGQTPRKLSNTHRGNEITWWLESHPCASYLVLDDLMYGDYSPEWVSPHESRLVLTPDGIEPEHVEQAVRMSLGDAQ